MMLSQPNSSLKFRRIMDDGLIFMADLSGLGTEVREVLGGFASPDPALQLVAFIIGQGQWG